MKMQLTAITQAMMEDPCFDIQEIVEINEGDCFRWAYVAYLLYGGSFYSFENKYLAHAFIKIDGKYYDCESPEGVDDWKQLRFFFEDRPSHIGTTLPILHEEEEFTAFWKFKVTEVLGVLKRSKEIINASSMSR